MDFEKIKQTMTKEEFLNDMSGSFDFGCPDEYELESEECKPGMGCKQCWNQAIETGNVKFKNDISAEQKVIEALKVVKEFCKACNGCLECKFYIAGICLIKDTTYTKPHIYQIKNLENLLKPQVNIYKVEHREGQQRYDFVSDEELPIGTIVVCDTKYGHTYGKVKFTHKGVDDGYKKCWGVK